MKNFKSEYLEECIDLAAKEAEQKWKSAYEVTSAFRLPRKIYSEISCDT